jgi:modification methylase
MLPDLARRAITAYSNPGDLVVDPLCGIGTTIVEAIHLGRHALGVELEPRWAALANANIAHAHDHGAGGCAGVLVGDARQLPRLLTRNGRDFLERNSAGDVARLGVGVADLILTSPPYACEVGELDKRAWGAGRDLCATGNRNYSADSTNLGHARGRRYQQAMSDIYTACAAVLKPGGFLVAVTKDLREKGALRDLAGTTAQLCQQAGLVYWQHVIALLATVRDGELVPRPSFWQIMQTRKAIARGERPQLVCHEDVLVFRKPLAPARRARAARAAA